MSPDEVYFWQKKNPEPIESTCFGLLELIARFELATSSLPRSLRAL